MSTSFERYPRWARTLAHGIRARLGNTFVLHGNTHDLVPAPVPAGQRPVAADFVPLTAFLADWMFGQRDVVIEYPARQRRRVPHARVAHLLHRARRGRRRGARHHVRPRRCRASRWPSARCSTRSSSRSCTGQPPLGVAVLLPYAETLVPESAGEASADDRAVRVFIQKWATDPALLAANVTIVLVTENLADISARIVRSPQTIEVEVDAPDEDERLQFLEAVRDDDWFTTQVRPVGGAPGAADLGPHAHPDPPDPVVGRRARRAARRRRRCASRRRRSSRPSATACSSTSSRASGSTWCRATRA